MRLSEIAIYPVKGGSQVLLLSAAVEARGLRGDRRWVVVDQNRRFVSQRELPALARLAARSEGDCLTLSLDGDRTAVRVPGHAGARERIRIWADELELAEAAEAAGWLSDRFGQPLRLFYQPDDAVRPTDTAWGKPGDQVSMADGFPLLIATTSSLDLVERMAESPVGMRRFRPNLVIEGASEGEDDGWATLRIGKVIVELVKPCARCVVTTVDQERGVVTGDEPIAALRQVRMSADRRVPGVLFGWNAAPRQLGTIHLGDPVEVLSRRDRWPIRQKSHIGDSSEQKSGGNEWSLPTLPFTQS